MILLIYRPNWKRLSEAQPEKFPVLVAGGYENAALYLKAKELKNKGVAFGGQTAQDILCVNEFEELGGRKVFK